MRKPSRKRTGGDAHVPPPRCTVVGCTAEGWKWFEDPAYPENTRYVCEDHIDLFHAATDDWWARNSEGKVVEVAEYACRDDCAVCWR